MMNALPSLKGDSPTFNNILIGFSAWYVFKIDTNIYSQSVVKKLWKCWNNFKWRFPLSVKCYLSLSTWITACLSQTCEAGFSQGESVMNFLARLRER